MAVDARFEVVDWIRGSVTTFVEDDGDFLRRWEVGRLSLLLARWTIPELISFIVF